MAKPASGTALDAGHALYTSLLHVWALLEGSTTTSVDSKGSNHLTLSSSGLWATNGGGENIIQIASETAGPLVPASAVAFDGSVDWSIALRAKQATSGTSGIVLGHDNPNNRFVFFNGGSQFRVRQDGGSPDSDFSLTTFTTTANYVLTYTVSDGKIRLYKDGTEINAGGITGNGKLSIGKLGSFSESTFGLVGDIEYVYVWSGRVLSGAEATALHADPYDFFGAAVTPLAPPVFQRRMRFFKGR